MTAGHIDPTFASSPARPPFGGVGGIRGAKVWCSIFPRSKLSRSLADPTVWRAITIYQSQSRVASLWCSTEICFRRGLEIQHSRARSAVHRLPSIVVVSNVWLDDLSLRSRLARSSPIRRSRARSAVHRLPSTVDRFGGLEGGRCWV